MDGNYLLQASARRHFVRDFAGPLSVKTVLEGQVSWSVCGKALTVRPGQMVVLNQGQEYSLEIDEEAPVRTRVAFFARGFVESACCDLKLDEPFAPPSAEFDTRVRPMNARLSAAMSTGDFVAIARELARDQVYYRRVPALRPATRDELLMRVMRGREFLDACVSEPVRLRDAAKAACLSDYHFHRVFRRVLGETPHAYLTRLRVESAAEQIRRGSSVTQAAIATGFGKPGALTGPFRSRFGVMPSEYAQNRKIWVALGERTS